LAVQQSKKMRIGVIGTRATVSSGIYDRKIKAIQCHAKVVMAACPLLVPLVEEGWLNRPETAKIIRKYLAPLKSRQIDTLILGCTHYPVLRRQIQQKIGKRVTLVDSAEAIANQVRGYLASHGHDAVRKPNEEGRCHIFVTDTAEQFKKTAQRIMRKRWVIEQADIQCAP